MNPMLATTWAAFGIGEQFKFPGHPSHYFIHWVGPCLAAILASMAYVIYAAGTMFYVTCKLFACIIWTQACNHIANSPLALSSQLELSHPAGHHLDNVKSKNDIHHSSGMVASSSLKLKQHSRLDLPGHAFGSGQFSRLQVLTLVNARCNVHGITQGSIECGCDGAGALNKVFNPDSETKTDGSQFDLLSAKHAALKASPIQWKYRHIQGHQHDFIDVELDCWALLNIEMDSLAKMHWLKMVDQPPPQNCTFTDEYWPTFITGQKIHSHLHNSLYKEIYQAKMVLRWESKNCMTVDCSMLVNWEACAGAMQCLKIPQKKALGF
jgi:hypothetical protein